MALFSLHRYAWNFPSNNHGQIFGIADSGVETFNGTPIKSMAREICQNSIDANLKNGEPTRIIFRTFEIAPSAIPGFDDLDDAFSRSLEYWSKQKSTKAKSFFQSALKLAKQPKITCLRISDTNTTGLLGSDEEYNKSMDIRFEHSHIFHNKRFGLQLSNRPNILLDQTIVHADNGSMLPICIRETLTRRTSDNYIDFTTGLL